jgi:hypothetical protein
MTDHAAARASLATSLDYALDTDESDVLEAHLRDCPRCRSAGADLRSDAATLRDLDFGPVPTAVRANVAIAAERHGRGSTSRWAVMAAMTAVLLVALGAAVFGAGGSTPPPATIDGNAVHWTTKVVELHAADFWIETNGQRFTATVAPIDVDSDPGDATYRTLEVTWKEHGVEMRLNLYFDGDGTFAWVREVRIYDGKPQGEWLTATGRFAPALLRAFWSGDLDVQFPVASGEAPARLHLGGLALRSIPFDGVNEPVGGGGIVLAENDQPFGPGGPLHCLGLLQMPPKQAEAILSSLGYKLSWRLQTTTGPNTGFAEPMARAPDGVIAITEPVVGGSGELIVFVAPFGDVAAKPIPAPDDCPPPGGAAPTPVP